MWTFSTTTVFSLKYIFKQIYFCTYISTQCQLGQLNLKNYLVNEEKTCFCGQYPDMINYSNSRKVDVTIFAKKLTLFMVVDAGLGLSNHLNSSETDTPVLGILFPISDVMLERFYVDTVRINKIILQFVYSLENSIIIHDAPGFKSKILKPYYNNKTEPRQISYFTSTFQCMIHFILKMYQSSSGMVLKYSNTKQNNMNQLSLNYGETRRISFPNLIQNESYRIDVFEISVPSGFYVNVSILNFKYLGFRISSCRYAGITTYNWVYRSYKEISKICKSHYSIYKSRKIYSKTSKWYRFFINTRTMVQLKWKFY